ncbi:MAG: hypothetical protein GY870_00335 [archaeon]|nr:hypothetical protein [archaeon]
MAPDYFFNTLSITIVIFFGISCILVYKKYKERGNELTKVLLLLFIANFVYLICYLTQLTLASYDPSIATAVAYHMNNPLSFFEPIAPIAFIWGVFYSLDILTFAVTNYYAQKCRIGIFAKEESGFDYIGNASFVAIIAAIITAFPPFYFLRMIPMMLSTAQFYFIFCPYFYEAFKTYNRLVERKEDNKFSRGILFIGIHAFLLVVRNLFIAFDSVFKGIEGFWNASETTPLNTFAWIFLFLAYIAIYFGYIRPGRKN